MSSTTISSLQTTYELEQAWHQTCSALELPDSLPIRYSAALDSQLAGTHMGSSFARVGDDPSAAGTANPQQPVGGAGGGATAPQPREAKAAPAHGDADADSELRPVDLDLNLVNNLLESFASQQGLPGPASNLAGMLGLSLPKETRQV